MKINHQLYGKHDPRLPLLTAIIPAYNESGRIGQVLSVLFQAHFVEEIIVVDDGSIDGMDAEVLQLARSNPRLKLIRHAENRGKGQAILTGFRASTSPVLLLLDADLISLTPQQVEALVQPVLSGEADMTIGLFKHGGFLTDLSHLATPWLSGQRCLRAGLISDLPIQAARGYGFETCLTILARQKMWRVKHVPWIGVTHALGILPRSGWSGLRRKAKMARDILWSWFLIELGWSGPVVRRYKIRRDR
jgi:glycosyltransferase involved in cell wall biosynthesis